MVDVAKVAEWFVSDDTGISSKCIAAFMLGADLTKARWKSPPSDPPDLGRCLRLLDKFPEWKERIPEMAAISKDWARTVAIWDEISQSMIEEVGINWEKGRSAPQTFKLMQRAEK